MGFFSDLVGIAAPILGALVGGPVGASAGVALAGLVGGDDKPMAAITGAVDVSGLSPAAQARVRAGTVGQVSLTTAQALARAAATGAARKRTTIETIDAMGKVIRSETFSGGVAVRAADVAAANRVFRQVSRLGRKLPKKLVKQSERARLTEELTEAALRRARDGADCPPKCP